MRGAAGMALTVALSADEANAVVYAIAAEVLTEGEELGHDPLSTTPGDLAEIERRCRRISRLAAINDQLLWRAHWGSIGGTPTAVLALEAVFLDVAAILQKRADEDREGLDGDDLDERFEFDRAARTIARAFAESGMVTA